MSAVGWQHPVLYYENHSGSPELSRCHEENAHHHGEHIRHTEEESSRNNTIPPSDSILERTTGGHRPEFSCCINLAGAASTAEASFRPVKRRGKARRKERRRTQNINSAFSELRDRIPNVPTDTKLSKIKTLRLATSYIAYLMNLLDTDDQNGETETFRAEFIKTDFKEDKRRNELNESLKTSENKADPRPRGRTGWPQYVWALELKL